MPFLSIFLATEITRKNEDNKIFFLFSKTISGGEKAFIIHVERITSDKIFMHFQWFKHTSWQRAEGGGQKNLNNLNHFSGRGTVSSVYSFAGSIAFQYGLIANAIRNDASNGANAIRKTGGKRYNSL